METKKSNRADLEKNSFVFFEIGLIIALSAMLVAFNWKTPEKHSREFGTRIAIDALEELVPITEQKMEQPKPPVPKMVSKIRIVEDDFEVEDDIVIDAEVFEDTEIEPYQPLPQFEPVEEVVEEAEIFYVVESMPQFPGGDVKLYEFLYDHLHYPEMAREAGIQGTVYVGFVVETDGSVTNIHIKRGIGGGCDEEAIKVIEMMPQWIPGKQRGIPVRVHFNLPVKFTLY
jgi:protein TonB